MDKLQLQFQNVRSLKTITKNRHELRNLKHQLLTEGPDVLSLVETWLDDSVLDHELEINGYHFFRKDRGSRGGGILVYIKDSIMCHRRSDLEPDNNSINEFLCLEISNSSSGSLLLVSFYRPPRPDTCFNNDLYEILCKHGKSGQHGKSGPKICLIGDLNLPEIRWSDLPDSPPQYRDLIDILTEHNLVQINKCPSRTDNMNILDVVLTNFPDYFSEVCYHASLIFSDHEMIEFSMGWPYKTKKSEVRWIYNFKNANYDELNYRIQELNLSSIVDKYNYNLDLAWYFWSFNIKHIINTYIPKFQVKNKTSPWIDGEALHHIHLKRQAWKKARQTNSEVDWSNYKSINNKCKSVLNRKYDEYINSSFNEINVQPKKFWNLVSIKGNKTSSLPHEMYFADNTFQNPEDKAESFNEFFFSSFNNAEYEPIDARTFNNDNLNLLQVSTDEVYRVLLDLDCTKATGPDNIPASFLRSCAHTLCDSLALLFNLSLRSGVLPSEWKKANIVPVFKKGDKRSVKNYRPVSLLSIVSKCLERLIFNKIYPVLDQDININQHGFRKGYSTTTQLLEFYDKLQSYLDQGIQCDAIYLDLAKAFDSVPHSLLLVKLKSFGICGALLKWFTNYLSYRSQRVVCEGKTSGSKPVLSGVPQGSILGPLLFILYINDLIDVCDVEIALYADDAKIMQPIFREEDCLKLQDTLNSIVSWSDQWGLKFNASKCKTISFTRSRHRINNQYYIHGISLEKVSSFCDLGIMVNSSLNWNDHVNSITNKASQRLGIVKRTIGFSASEEVKKACIKTFVLPLLEYGTQLWGNCNFKSASRVEQVQRRASRYILNEYNSDYDYRTRLIKCDMLPLSFRRSFLDLSFLLKLLHEENCLNFLSYYTFLPETRTRDGFSLRCVNNNFRTSSFRSFYFNRVCHEWNSLPLRLREECTEDNGNINVYKHVIKDHLKDVFLNRYDVDNKCTWKLRCFCNNCLLI